MAMQASAFATNLSTDPAATAARADAATAERARASKLFEGAFMPRITRILEMTNEHDKSRGPFGRPKR
ncbi:MAG: hypothetical protein CTY36_10815 [Methylocystis sp.]|nr:MAG: hypothetical protein CTY36_10815 [Methylocystis sp.]